MQHNYVAKSLYKASSEVNCYRDTVEITCFSDSRIFKLFVRSHQLFVVNRWGWRPCVIVPIMLLPYVENSLNYLPLKD